MTQTGLLSVEFKSDTQSVLACGSQPKQSGDGELQIRAQCVSGGQTNVRLVVNLGTQQQI
jgi:hypothetical protein